MADITGPIHTLPGASHDVPDGACCDMHQDRLAVARIQGETDSFGSELYDVCQECLEEIRNYKDVGVCDWCHTESALRPYRDLDEGRTGPVYRVCAACRRKDQEWWAAEASEYEHELD